ncbi:hypothetical protein [Bdellovibrio sp. HCB-162]|uniref:hypothetical protein n=1 Tax=Bdellovibrio sp. HCB-162 TaxID=3394234 RepID=UPI0039BCF280
MKKNLSLILVMLFLGACATKPKSHDSGFEDLKETKHAATAKKTEKVPAEPAKASSIVVDSKDLQVLEKMTKAVELYVLKNDKKQFTSLCKDKRFDCFVDDKAYPKTKKKIARSVPPYASGSKMGLQGEQRVHVKYDFYP